MITVSYGGGNPAVFYWRNSERVWNDGGESDPKHKKLAFRKENELLEDYSSIIAFAAL